jgi:predicted nucleic acid-binding protein
LRIRSLGDPIANLIRHLLDTNVISETARPRPDSRAVEWIVSHQQLSLTAVTLYEISADLPSLVARRHWLTRLYWSDAVGTHHLVVLMLHDENMRAMAAHNAAESMARSTRSRAPLASRPRELVTLPAAVDWISSQ